MPNPRLTITLPLEPAAAGEALAAVLVEEGYVLEEGAVPSSGEFLFLAKRTLTRNALIGGARVSPTEGGASVYIGLDVVPGEPKGLLDDRRLGRILRKFAETAVARLGGSVS